MYGWEKSMSETRSVSNKQNPSFSSTLLEKIYHSIEEGNPKHHDKLNCSRGTQKKPQGDHTVMGGRAAAAGEERISSTRRTAYEEKIILDNKAAEKFEARRERSLPEFDRRSKYDNDPLFFSSTSSDSSSSGFPWSESESVLNGAKAMPSCFLPPKPKPIRTKVSSQLQNKTEGALFRKQGNLHSHYDDDDKENEECNLKSKSRALKIYASFKKVKQPISPGVRLSKFINALFSNGQGKKSKNSSSVGDLGDDYGRSKSMPPSQPASSCSSASSFSRSCLSKNSPTTRERLRNGVKRSVTFYPVSEIVSEDPRSCGRKSVYPEDESRGNLMNLGSMSNVELLQGKTSFLSNDCCNLQKEDNEYDDSMSDSSSDLFELDHTAFTGDKSRYSQDLPVYETTYVNKNHVIARA